MNDNQLAQLIAACDTVIRVEETDQPGILRVECQKQRNAEPFPTYFYDTNQKTQTHFSK